MSSRVHTIPETTRMAHIQIPTAGDPFHHTHLRLVFVILQRTRSADSSGGQVRMLGEGSEECLELDVRSKRIARPICGYLLQL